MTSVKWSHNIEVTSEKGETAVASVGADTTWHHTICKLRNKTAPHSLYNCLYLYYFIFENYRIYSDIKILGSQLKTFLFYFRLGSFTGCGWSCSCWFECFSPELFSTLNEFQTIPSTADNLFSLSIPVKSDAVLHQRNVHCSLSFYYRWRFHTCFAQDFFVVAFPHSHWKYLPSDSNVNVSLAFSQTWVKWFKSIWHPL